MTNKRFTGNTAQEIVKKLYKWLNASVQTRTQYDDLLAKIYVTLMNCVYCECEDCKDTEYYNANEVICNLLDTSTIRIVGCAIVGKIDKFDINDFFDNSEKAITIEFLGETK